MAAECGMDRNSSTLLLLTLRCGLKRTQVVPLWTSELFCNSHTAVFSHTLHRVDYSYRVSLCVQTAHNPQLFRCLYIL